MLQSVAIQSILDLESLREFSLKRVLPVANECQHSERFPLDLYREIHTGGWMQAAVPQEYGGLEVNTIDLACIARTLAYGSSGVMMSTIVNSLGLTAIGLYAREELKKELLTAYVGTFSLWSFCMTEPDAGTDVARIRTAAVKVEKGFRLSGQKCFITNAGYSDHLIVFARVPGPDAGISAFYVRGDSKGVTRGKPLEKLGQKDSNTGELFFDDVFVPETQLLGSVGEGLRIMHHCIQRSKTLVAAGAIGICDRAFDLVSAHLRSREHYGKPLLDLWTIRNFIAELQTKVEAGWLLVCKAAATWDTGVFAIKEASMAKMWCTDLAVRYTNEAVELFGGYGYSKECETERLYRDSKALEILEGATFIQQMLIAKELFGPEAGSASDARKKAA